MDWLHEGVFILSSTITKFLRCFSASVHLYAKSDTVYHLTDWALKYFVTSLLVNRQYKLCTVVFMLNAPCRIWQRAKFKLRFAPRNSIYLSIAAVVTVAGSARVICVGAELSHGICLMAGRGGTVAGTKLNASLEPWAKANGCLVETSYSHDRRASSLGRLQQPRSDLHRFPGRYNGRYNAATKSLMSHVSIKWLGQLRRDRA